MKSGTPVTEVKKGPGGYRHGAGRPVGSKNQTSEVIVVKGRVVSDSTDRVVDNILPSGKIIDIINICKSSNIKNLKYGNLEIEFISNPAPIAEVPKTAAAPDPVKKMFSQHDDTELEDLRMNQLMIDDPAAFEQEIIDSHIGRFNAAAQN